MIFVIGSARYPASVMGQLRPHMAAVIEATRAEDGCLYYAFGEDVTDPGLLRISEVWRDQAALDRHFTTPHMTQWKAARAALGAGERNLMLYKGTGESQDLP